LMGQLRRSVSTSTDDFEKRLQTVGELVSHSSRACNGVEERRLTGVNELWGGEAVEQEWIKEQSNTSWENVGIPHGRMWDAAEEESGDACWETQPHTAATTGGARAMGGDKNLSVRGDSKEHANASDIAEEGLSTSVRPHAPSIHGASREALAARLFPPGKLIALGEPVQGM